MSNNNQVPFQVQQIIDNMLNTKDNVYVRGNYRARLDIIQEEINKAIRKYDSEVHFSDNNRKKKA